MAALLGVEVGAAVVLEVNLAGSVTISWVIIGLATVVLTMVSRVVGVTSSGCFAPVGTTEVATMAIDEEVAVETSVTEFAIIMARVEDELGALDSDALANPAGPETESVISPDSM